MSKGSVDILEERKPINLEKLDQIAEQYLDAHNKRASTKTTMARYGVKDIEFAGSGSQRVIVRFLACDGRGHRILDCSSKASTFENELNSCFRRSYCYECGSKGHDTKDCRNSSLHPQPTQLRPEERDAVGNITKTRQVNCAMQVSLSIAEKGAETGIETLELKF